MKLALLRLSQWRLLGFQWNFWNTSSTMSFQPRGTHTILLASVDSFGYDWSAEYCDDVRNIKAACYAMVSHFGLEWTRKKLMQERLLMLDDPRIDDQEPVMKSPLELLVLSSCLSVAASAGDLSVVQTLLQASEDPNENNSLFGYPLYAAASAGQPSCVQMLLEAGADAAISKGRLGTPMEAAACLGRLEVVRTLAHNGVDLGFSLADAIENDQISVAEFLLSLDRVDVNAGRDEGKLPIFVAMTKNHRQTAVLLAQRPELHPNVMDTRGRTPLHKAVLESEYRVARVLLSRQEVDPNMINWNLGTPLHIACTGSYTILVKEFLSHDNVDVNMEDRNGYTPLYTALLNGRRSIVSLLLQHPKVDASIGPRSQSPLVLAARGNNVEAIGPLLERPEVRASAFFYESVRQSIFVAVIQGYAQMTRLLLGRHPVNINDFSYEGWHPLHYAIRAFAHGMKLLLSIDGIDVNFLCHNLTPLICAVLTQNMEAVKLLLSRSDIDINISGPRGTALSCSLFKTDRVPAVADLLLRRADLDPNVAGRKQRTATIRITKEAKTAPVIGAYYSYFLQREGAVQEIGKPPLVKAASRGKVAVMERLLSLGTINPNAVDGDSRTALWWATNASSRAGEK
ncbi:ankyrin repeat protein [Grosmannia clavigera kw1407]|uniref:Ankyrin repeat protein n=1 Tax=Grosmannia clavigera (strain kw1407 / UAMH 11150) TaxID=655863 RepID=F0XDZ4_GROCL|nr:ankyrin repeat protein [Grosmannia clavigera kw1407]EFX04346.1 ankyrin repeat protein [Grosmannia clavigera kw1407]